MKRNFEAADFQALQAMVSEIKSGYSEGVIKDDYFQQVLMERLPDLTQTEAEEVVNEIEMGIADFNRGYNEGQKESQAPCEQILRDAISSNKMDDAASVRYLASVVVMMRMQELSVTEINEEQIESLLNEIIDGREFNSETVEAVLKEAVESIDQNGMIAVDEEMAEHFVNVPLDVNTIHALREEASNPSFVAIAAYIAGKKGEFEMLESFDTPRNIAVGIASGLKNMQLTADLSEGRITSSQWMKGVKIAIGVALGLGIAYIAFNVVTALSVGLFAGVAILLGAGTVAVIAAAVLAMGYLVWTACHLSGDLSRLVPVYDKCFDKTVEWIAQFMPKAAEYIKTLYIRIKEKLSTLTAGIKGDKVKEETSVEERVTTVETPVMA